MQAPIQQPDALDIQGNRKARKYSRKEMVLRVLWLGGKYLVRFSPRPLFGWRRFVLRLFGAEIGPGVHLYGSTHVYMPWNFRAGAWSSFGEDVLIYNLGPVTVGERATVSHRAHVCAGTHDYRRPDLPLLKPPIYIGDQVWICADAFVGPGITVGEGAIVGAAAVATRDVPPWTIVAGNPAVAVKRRQMRPPAADAPASDAPARTSDS